MMTTNSSFPRVYSLAPDDISLTSSNLGAFTFTVTGANLPCTNNPATCGTSIRFVQGANTYTSSCTGAVAGITLNCSINVSGIAAGSTRMIVQAGSNTLTIPTGSFLGGFNVSN